MNDRAGDEYASMWNSICIGIVRQVGWRKKREREYLVSASSQH